MSHALARHRIPIGLFRFRIAPIQTLFVPSVNKGNMLRGGFGQAFRRLCCVPQCRDSRSCPLNTSCPYREVFEPSPPTGAESLSKNQDIPRPFVFRAPRTQQTRFEKGEPFEFELVLIGRALDFLAYFVLAFRQLAGGGLGLNRAKCNLERVDQIKLNSGQADIQNEIVYTAHDQLVRATESWAVDEWIENRLQKPFACEFDAVAQRITIQFLTPTFLRADGEVIRRPEFHHLFKRLRDRVNSLSTFFGDGPLDFDFLEFGRRAERVRTVACDVKWVERFRTSSKTRQRHELSGFAGEATYEGHLSELLPWLALGELIHVGKHAAWGNGWYEVSTAQAATNETKGAYGGRTA
jgi:CRISPR/Cas system endoribonuclease Cas6 (RAMP superfamily)